MCAETASDRFDSAAENKKNTATNKPPYQGHQLSRKALLPKPEGYVEEKTVHGLHRKGGDRRNSGSTGDRRRKVDNSIIYYRSETNWSRSDSKD